MSRRGGGIDFDYSDVLEGLERKLSQIEEAAKQEMGDCMDDLLAESTNIAPMKDGALRNDSYTTTASDGSTVEGYVYYWGVSNDGKSGNFDYALKVHEMGEYKNPSTKGTKPKFLSEPLKKNAAAYRERIANAISKAVK